MEYLLSFVLVLAELISVSLVADGILNRKNKSVFRFCTILLIFAFISVSTAVLLSASALVLKYVVMVMILLSMIFLNYNGGFGIKLFLCSVFFALDLALDYIIMSACMAFFSYSYYVMAQNSAIFILSSFTSKLILLMAAYFFKKIRCKKYIQNIRAVPFMWPLLIVPGFSVFNLIFVIDSAVKRNEISVWIFAEAIGLLLCNMFMIFLWDKFEEDNQIRTENVLLQQEIKNNMENLLALETSYKKQRSLTHEFQNHASVVQGLLENNSIEQALAHLHEWTKIASTKRQIVNTNNQIIDIVLNQQYECARQRGITMSFLINDLSGIKVKDEDIVTLLTNALDNAIEAASLCKTEKSIRVKIKRNVGFHFLISVRNTSNPVKIINNQIETSKENSMEHGFGLQNIRQIVKQYDGDYIVLYKDGWFQFTAILPETT